MHTSAKFEGRANVQLIGHWVYILGLMGAFKYQMGKFVVMIKL